MNGKIILGVTIVLILVIYIVFSVRKENFSQFGDLIPEKGNISVSTVQNNQGIVISNIGNNPSSWRGQIGKLIGFKTYQSQPTWNSGDTIISVPISENLTPDMIIIAEMTMTLANYLKANTNSILVDGASISISGGIGNQISSAFILTFGDVLVSNRFKLVFSGLSGNLNTFTATINSTIISIGDNFMRNPVTDSVFIYAIIPP